MEQVNYGSETFLYAYKIGLEQVNDKYHLNSSLQMSGINEIANHPFLSKHLCKVGKGQRY